MEYRVPLSEKQLGNKGQLEKSKEKENVKMSPKNRPEIEFELSNEELQTMSGAMTCQDAINAANVYIAVGDLLSLGGCSAGAANYYGQAQGVIQVACTK